MPALSFIKKSYNAVLPPAIPLLHRKVTSQGRRKALLIGINYIWASTTTGNDRLRGPIKDVQHMKEVLVEYYGYLEEDIVVMTDEHLPNQHTDIWPTRKNILHQLRNLVSDARRGDTFVFHFAGHSMQKKAQRDKKEKDGKDEAIITCDHKYILDDILHYMLVDKLPPGCKLTAIFDTCHSGTLLDLTHYECNEGLKASRSVPELVSAADIQDLRREFQQLRRMTISKDDRKISTILRKIITRPFKAKLYAVGHFVNRSIRVSSSKGSAPSQALARCTHRCPAPVVRLNHRSVVISLSACTDDQRTWEDRDNAEASMSKILCNLLKQEADVPAFKVLEHVRTSIHEHTFKRHRIVLKEHHSRFKTARPNPKKYPLDLDRPQLGSLHPLHRNEPFILKPT
ncbi:hypothetical protein EVG20_g5155 [Dentipellis fragilis]|uniref:Peptidase C14 caspase domain-containing protein n=1 Tax=Dentipellis fragilis TaxID=205917 RepID=A0A4Y9YXS2_9AGAM|nr:hypothetical protein EVG20_g5155 [Dentipellis fragilis]